MSKSELIETVKELEQPVQELERFCHVGAAASECFGGMEGRAESFVRRFRKGSRERKDYSAEVNFRLAKLVFDVARNGRR
jgi:hypothetical protein